MSNASQYIAVDLSSLVRLDTRLYTADEICPSITARSDIDNQAIDTVRYAIDAGKCIPVFIGRTSPMLTVDTLAYLKHVSNGKFLYSFAKFCDTSISDLKMRAVNFYTYIIYAFDRVEKDFHIWDDQCIEVLN